MREPRIAVMILGEASWEEPGGMVRTVPACMEDKSAGGACIRVPVEIGVGSRLRVKCRHEQFSGVSKYCRSEGNEFLVGVQRDKATARTSRKASRAAVPRIAAAGQNGAASASPPVTEKKGAPLPDKVMAPVSEALPRKYKKDISSMFPVPLLERRPQLPAKEKDFAEVRKPMRSKWFDLARWHHKDETPEIGSSQDGKAAPQATGNGQEPTAAAAAGIARPQIELLPVEDIYRAAGIMNLKGCNIHKVVEMVRSEHIRSLSNDLKRAAVLMALETAAIPVEQVLQDAKARKDALEFYEAEQKKQMEAEWSRKVEENSQIQADLDRLKEQYMARVNRNLESVAREKATFNAWLATKQREAQNIAEAAELCAKTAAPKSVEAAAGAS